MPLNAEIIKKNMKNDIAVRVFDVIDSTNSEAKRMAERDRGSYALYAADSQTAGRGRLGRSFYSPEGGLYMTVVLPVRGSAEGVQRVTCAAAVAVCEAISDLTGLSPSVKWVNDIYVNGRKAAGILAELICGADNAPISIALGIGINLTTETFPDELAGKAVSIGYTDPSLLCAAIADRLIEQYERLSDNSFMEKYISLNIIPGKLIRYADSGGEHTALAKAITADGSLEVEENGVTSYLSSGEVTIIGFNIDK